MKIKKVFAPMIDMLSAAVSDGHADQSVLDAAYDIAAAKTGGGSSAPRGLRTALKDTNGEVVAVLCGYFKRWMPLVGPEAVEFGAKKGSPTGLNPMSKAGVAAWTKQQAEAKKALAAILVDVEAGTLAASDIAARREEIEAERKQIAQTDAGFESIMEVTDYLEAQGVTLAE